jgi:peptidyl-prolyl cis-trans isomerase B (cyclophilin B)
MPRTGAQIGLLAVLACLALVAGCGGDDSEQAAAPATPTPEDTGGEQSTGCAQVSRPAPKDTQLAAPKTRLKAGRTYVATIKTSCGTFAIKLDPKRAPKTGGSFKYLADKGFYDDTTFHRISPGFVIQGGDPLGDGSGGPGYSVVEKPPADLTYDKGVAAMAKTQTEAPGTSGSQFFVVTADGVNLPPDYALLGKVTKGQRVVDLIGQVPVGPDEQPADPVVIEKVTVAES